MKEETTTVERVIRPLTPRMKRFIAYYLELWNASAAAAKCGYKYPRKIASDLMSRPDVKEAIDHALKDQVMRANEVLIRLSKQATLNISDFYSIQFDPNLQKDVPVINWQAVFDNGYLIKGIKYDRYGNPILEFYDAQKALELIGKNLKLFTDTVDLNLFAAVKGYASVSPDDWDKPTDQA